MWSFDCELFLYTLTGIFLELSTLWLMGGSYAGYQFIDFQLQIHPSLSSPR